MKPSAALDSDMLDATALGRVFGVSRRTIYRWVADAGLPSVRLSPGVRRFDRGEVGRWLIQKNAEGELEITKGAACRR
jgi:excisionase family DNA binding protein